MLRFLIKTILANLIRFTVVLSVFGVFLVLFFHFKTEKPSSIFFAPFFIGVICARVWESFFTSREPQRTKIEKDWCLALITIGYSALLLICIFDFYRNLSPLYVDVSILGTLIFTCAYFVRWWGVKTLANQWSIHAIGESRIALHERSLIKEGPYRLVRHPIYAGIFMEILAIPLIANSLYALLFSMCLLIPLYAFRSYLEEKTLMKIFGWGYKQYRKESSAFVPIRIPNPKFSDRRKNQKALLGPEKRREDDRRENDRRRNSDRRERLLRERNDGAR
jgi:protein-S-isoprenylcysteine O-methyltransferase Ste14